MVNDIQKKQLQLTGLNTCVYPAVIEAIKPWCSCVQPIYLIHIPLFIAEEHDSRCRKFESVN